MTDTFNTIGLGIDASQAKAGADQYNAALDAVAKKTQQTAQTGKDFERSQSDMARAMGATGGAAEQLMTTLKLLAASWAVNKIREVITDVTMLAARYDTLGVVMNTMGRNAGISAQQLQDVTKVLQEQGITMKASREAVIGMIQAHIDLSKATELATIAQNTAQIANLNSSETYTNLLHVITSGYSEMAKQMGLEVSFEAAYKRSANALGVKSSALSEHDKLMARYNEVIRAASAANGVYAASMDTAGKQIKTLERYHENLKIKIGETFQPVLSDGVKQYTRFIKELSDTIDRLAEDGSLDRWAMNMRVAMASLQDGIRPIIILLKELGVTVRTTLNVADIVAKNQPKSDNSIWGWLTGGAMSPIKTIQGLVSAKKELEVELKKGQTDLLGLDKNLMHFPDWSKGEMSAKQHLDAAIAAQDELKRADAKRYKGLGERWGDPFKQAEYNKQNAAEKKTGKEADPYGDEIDSLKRLIKESDLHVEAMNRLGNANIGLKRLEVETALAMNDYGKISAAKVAALRAQADMADYAAERLRAYEALIAQGVALKGAKFDMSSTMLRGGSESMQPYFDLAKQMQTGEYPLIPLEGKTPGQRKEIISVEQQAMLTAIAQGIAQDNTALAKYNMTQGETLAIERARQTAREEGRPFDAQYQQDLDAIAKLAGVGTEAQIKLAKSLAEQAHALRLNDEEWQRRQDTLELTAEWELKHAAQMDAPESFLGMLEKQTKALTDNIAAFEKKIALESMSPRERAIAEIAATLMPPENPNMPGANRAIAKRDADAAAERLYRAQQASLFDKTLGGARDENTDAAALTGMGERERFIQEYVARKMSPDQHVTGEQRGALEAQGTEAWAAATDNLVKSLTAEMKVRQELLDLKEANYDFDERAFRELAAYDEKYKGRLDNPDVQAGRQALIDQQRQTARIESMEAGRKISEALNADQFKKDNADWWEKKNASDTVDAAISRMTEQNNQRETVSPSQEYARGEVEKLKKELDLLSDSEERAAAVARITAEALRSFSLKQQRDELKNMVKDWEEAGNAADKYREVLGEIAAGFSDQQDTYRSIIKGTDPYETERQRLYNEGVKRATAAKDGMTPGANTLEDISQYATDTVALKRAADAITKQREEWTTFVGSITTTFHDAFLKMLEHGKGGWSAFVDSLKATWKSLLGDMIFKATIQPVIAGALGSIGSALGIGSSVLGGSSGGGILGSLGSLGGLGSSLGSIGNTLGLGSLFGGAAAGTGLASGGAALAGSGMGLASAGTALGGGTGIGLASGGTALAGSGIAGAGAGVSGALAAVPGWGWAALAAVTAASLLGGDDGPRQRDAYFRGGAGNLSMPASQAMDAVMTDIGTMMAQQNTLEKALLASLNPTQQNLAMTRMSGFKDTYTTLGTEGTSLDPNVLRDIVKERVISILADVLDIQSIGKLGWMSTTAEIQSFVQSFLQFRATIQASINEVHKFSTTLDEYKYNTEGVFAQWIDSGTKIKAITENWGGSTDQVQALTDAMKARYTTEMQLVTQVQDQIKASSDMIASDVRTVTLAGMSTTGQKLGYLQQEAGSAYQQLGQTMDPASITKLEGQLRGTLSEAWGMLTPQQQQQYGQQFIADYKAIGNLVETQLQKAQDAVDNQGAADLPGTIAAAIKGAMDQAGYTMLTAAQIQLQAAQTWAAIAHPAASIQTAYDTLGRALGSPAISNAIGRALGRVGEVGVSA